MRRLFVRTAAAAAVLAMSNAATASAQIPTSSFEITPLAGYLWGGGFDTPNNGLAPAGKISVQPSFAWGGELGYTPNGTTWFELTYLHQGTDANFEPNGNVSCPDPANNCTAPFSTNYIHAGARWEFGPRNIKPFIGAGMGVTIFDPGQTPNGLDFGSSTDFSISGEVGVIYMVGKKAANQRFGLRATFRGWWTFVPSGQYAAWCGYYGCYAVEESATVAQGELTGGLVIRF
jgi:hypothetical protein